MFDPGEKRFPLGVGLILHCARGLGADSSQLGIPRGLMGLAYEGDIEQPDIALATIHVTAGEPESAALAHRAITSVAELRSVRATISLVRLRLTSTQPSIYS
jgi:hypothetical protein